MDYLGIYIFNATKAAWLQDDERSWGTFDSVAEFTNERIAEDVRERVSGDDVTYTMAALH